MSYTGKTIDLSKYDKYGKQVELTKVEVELNIAKDIVLVMKEAQKDWSAASGKEDKILSLASDAISDYKQARIKYNDAVKAYEKLESSAKELGLDVPKEVRELAGRAKSFVDEGAEKIKFLQSVRK